MGDEELDQVFSVWSKPEVTELINEVGEIENPIPLGIRMLREVPEFKSLAMKSSQGRIVGLICSDQYRDSDSLPLSMLVWIRKESPW